MWIVHLADYSHEMPSLFSEIIKGQDNSNTDSDAVWSESALFAYYILSDTLVYEKLATFTVLFLITDILVNNQFCKGR